MGVAMSAKEKTMRFSRRDALKGVLALGVVNGCRTLPFARTPDLRIGVISDIHVMTAETTTMFRRALRYFRSRNVDAVICSGDLSDWGLRSGLQFVKDAWDAEMSGSGIVPLFCTGNHDWEGWGYGDMTTEMHALGYSEDENLEKLGMKKCWEEIWGEPWEPVRERTVKGYSFVSAEFRSEAAAAKWLKANAARLKGDKPFFYFQHVPIIARKTDYESEGVASALSSLPNCIAMTGHVHVPFNDERSIVQDGFTELSVPSLSYAGAPGGHENGYCQRDPAHATMAMQCLTDRFDMRGGQGYVVSLYDDEMVVERRDLEEGVDGADAWIVPLPMGREQPYGLARRTQASQAPSFPAGAAVEIDTRNATLRNGCWCAVMTCRFPSATIADGTRVYDYEIRAVPRDGSAPMVKRFLSPAYAKLPKYEPERQFFWFDVADLPQDKEYVIEVVARNYFGKCSAPIVSSVRRGKPGLTKAFPRKDGERKTR